MPFNAILGGENICSLDYTSDSWSELKKEVKKRNLQILLPCCNEDGLMRTSKLGLHHFYHKHRDLCSYKPESIQHLKSKALIFKACKASGWDAYIEFQEGEWIADILTTNGKRRIAFEVQWSKQTAEDTIIRQKKYEESNVTGVWFFKSTPKGLQYDWEKSPQIRSDLPMFQLYESSDKEMMVKVEQNSFKLYDFIISLFAGHFKICSKVNLNCKQNFEIKFYNKTCWSCGSLQHGYFIEGEFQSKCGLWEDIEESGWSEESFDKSIDVQEVIKEIQKTVEGKQIRIGPIKERYSKTVQSKYLSFGCIDCGVLFGDWFQLEERIDHEHDEDLLTFKVQMNPNVKPIKKLHWCYSVEKDFCE